MSAAGNKTNITTTMQPSGANWVRNLVKLNSTIIDYMDNFYRQRLRALQAFDELVDNLFKKLEHYDLLDNTYIIYTSGEMLGNTSQDFTHDSHRQWVPYGSA